MANNYDKIAKNYDFLSRLVFGKAQVMAQINQLKFIQNNNSILIVGGGTGWILEEIAKFFPQGLRITYIELSEQMILLAQKRNCGANEVFFINTAIENYPLKFGYDIVLTPFLFDNFLEAKAVQIFNQISASLNTQGKWLFVDFSLKNRTRWKMAFLNLMYLFFKTLKIIEATKLVEMDEYFKVGYKIIEEKFYYRSFIRANVYQKLN